MYCLTMSQKTTILRALVEGNSIRSIERMTGHQRDTILRLLVSVGKEAKFVMNTLIRNVRLNRLEVDELWTFVRKKDKRVKPTDPASFGSQYVFVAIDAKTKLVPCFRIGGRDLITAGIFMWDLQRRLKGRPQLTTDGLSAYEGAVDFAFGENVDYAQLVKVYHSIPYPNMRLIYKDDSRKLGQAGSKKARTLGYCLSVRLHTGFSREGNLRNGVLV